MHSDDRRATSRVPTKEELMNQQSRQLLVIARRNLLKSGGAVAAVAARLRDVVPDPLAGLVVTD